MQYASTRVRGASEDDDIYDSEVYQTKVEGGSIPAADGFFFSDCIDGIRLFKRHTLTVICFVIWNLPPQVQPLKVWL